MHFVYILRAKKDKRLYIGCTKDLKQRIKMHNSGKIESTRERYPFELIHYEVFKSKKDAFAREQWLKTGWGRNHLKSMLKTYLKSLGG